MRAAALLLLWLAFLGGLTFTVVYHVTAKWWRSDVGRNMFAFAACETAVIGLSLARALFGDFPGRAALALVLFAAFTGVTWWRTVVLLRAQRRVDRV